MRKVIFALLVQFLVLSAQAIDVEINGINYELISKLKTAKVISKSQSYYGHIVIPETVEYDGTTYTVTTIGRVAFYLCRALDSVTLPGTVTVIEEHAFDHSGIQSINIPNVLATIGYEAFEACTNLNTINIASIVSWCKIEFGDYNANPLTYAHHLYVDGVEIRELVLPDGITSIGNSVFSGGSAIVSVSIPESVTVIGVNAFSECTGLTKIHLPEHLTAIGTMAFAGCRNLENVSFPNSLTDIGTWAFSDCRNITSVVLPSGMTTVNQEIFKDCTNLTTVTIPSGVTKILWGAFANCSELTDVYCYAENVPETYYDVFSGSLIDFATLHVPASAIANYQKADVWKEFGKIVALTEDELAVRPITTNDTSPIHYYNVGGQILAQPKQGVNIIRQKNGHIIKVMCK